MQKITIALLTIVLFSSCTEKKSDKNLEISGTIKGFKKGRLNGGEIISCLPEQRNFSYGKKEFSEK